MAFDISEKNQKKLDVVLETILRAYQDDDFTIVQARELLADIMTLAARGDEKGFLAWLGPQQLAAWLTTCKAVIRPARAKTPAKTRKVTSRRTPAAPKRR